MDAGRAQVRGAAAQRVAWTSTSGSDQSGVVTFHRLGEMLTRVTVQMDFDPEGVVETVGDKLGVLDRRVKGDLKRFKDFIESEGYETGEWRGEVPRPTRKHHCAAPPSRCGTKRL